MFHPCFQISEAITSRTIFAYNPASIVCQDRVANAHNATNFNATPPQLLREDCCSQSHENHFYDHFA
jgi:hypothetical protein